jgi:hypothetical protein
MIVYRRGHVLKLQVKNGAGARLGAPAHTRKRDYSLTVRGGLRGLERQKIRGPGVRRFGGPGSLRVY